MWKCWSLWDVRACSKALNASPCRSLGQFGQLPRCTETPPRSSPKIMQRGGYAMPILYNLLFSPFEIAVRANSVTENSRKLVQG